MVIDLTLRIEALPEPGGDVFADEAGMGLGGGYNVLVAARRLGVETLFVTQFLITCKLRLSNCT